MNKYIKIVTRIQETEIVVIKRVHYCKYPITISAHRINQIAYNYALEDLAEYLDSEAFVDRTWNCSIETRDEMIDELYKTISVDWEYVSEEVYEENQKMICATNETDYFYSAYFDSNDKLQFLELSREVFEREQPLGKWFNSKEEVIRFLGLSCRI